MGLERATGHDGPARPIAPADPGRTVGPIREEKLDPREARPRRVASATSLCRHDRLAIALIRLSGERTWLVAAIAFAVYGILGFGAGVLISLYDRPADPDFLGILDELVLPLSVFIYLIVSPTVWVFYCWQPGAILKVFGQLSRNQVLTSGGESQDAITTFVESYVATSLNRPRYQIIAYVFAGLSLFGWLLWILVDPFHLIVTRYWWHANPFYFWLVWLPLVFVNVYMMVWAVLRQILAIGAFGALFRRMQIAPKPFHPDRCNGLASVGDFSLRCGAVAVMFGFWVLIMTSFQILLNGSTNLPILTAASILLYVLAVSLLLIPPAWGAHLAMQQAKDEALEVVARQMRTLLANEQLDSVPSALAQIKQLDEKMQLIDRAYRTWPFQPVALKNFSLAAVAPIATPLLSAIGAALTSLIRNGLSQPIHLP
jgi:hypothetical protein